VEILAERLEHALAAQLRAVHHLTSALHSAQSAEAFYQRALDTIIEVLDADRASLLLFDRDGVMRFKAWRALSPEFRAAVEGFCPWTPAQTDVTPWVVPDVEADPDLVPLLPVIRQEGIRSVAVVPLVNRDGLVGKFMLCFDRAHPFPATDVALAEVVAGHIALAIERQSAQKRLRGLAVASRLAVARLSILQKVTAELSRAITVADVADVVLGVALQEMGATSGSLCMLDGDHVRLAAAVNYPPEVLENWTAEPIEADLPACEAIRTGRVIFLEGSIAERLGRNPCYADRPLVGSQAYAVVPLGTEIRFGALVVGFDTPRHFTEEQEQFLTSLAAQCAAALGRAELYEERERARLAAEASRTRLAFLAETTAALAASLDYETTLARVADLAVPSLADMCTIYLLEGTRGRLVGAAHADDGRIEELSRLLSAYPLHHGIPDDVAAELRAGVTLRYRTREEFLAGVTTSAEQREVLAALDLMFAAVVPISVRGRTIGALALGTEAGRTIDDEAVSLAEQLADRAGTAIDVSRLFTARTSAARQLQASLLPPQLPDVPGLDLGARYLAGSAGLEVGGDFYDVFPVAADRHLVVLGDVCGRGVEAANTALLIRHVIRSAAVDTRSPAGILAHLNDVLVRESQEREDARFATALVAEIEVCASGVRITLAVAGHPHPILRDPVGQLRTVGVPGTLLGVIDDAEFTDVTLFLPPRHALVCFTDGATECRRGRHFFGENGVAETIAGASGGAGDLAAALEAAVLDFTAGTPSDDLAILVLQPKI
jgi:GAF domain-containing protein